LWETLHEVNTKVIFFLFDKIFLGFGQLGINHKKIYRAEFVNGKMHGFGIMYLDKPGQGFRESYVGSFVDGDMNGIGIKDRSKDGYLIDTVSKGKHIVTDSRVQLTGLDRSVVAFGKAKKHLGRDVKGFTGCPQDGLFGCLYGAGGGVLYAGQICYVSQEAFGFGARLWKQENGYGYDFGLWRNGEKLRCLSSVEIIELKLELGLGGIIFV
jgi:hypothetical protein